MRLRLFVWTLLIYRHGRWPWERRSYYPTGYMQDCYARLDRISMAVVREVYGPMPNPPEPQDEGFA